MKSPYICPQIEKLGLENEDQLLAGSPDLGINTGEEVEQWTNKAGTDWVNEEGGGIRPYRLCGKAAYKVSSASE